MSNFVEDINSEDGVSPLTQATARFIVYFAKQTRAIQQSYVMSWYRSAFQYWQFKSKDDPQYSRYHFQVPILCDPENGLEYKETLPYVCMSAMHLISGKKVSFWATCMRAVQSNTIPEHGLVGRESNNGKFASETLDDLCSFFYGSQSIL
jgi:hypothetical protein